ncbi:MAG: beta-Ala-His dipeptidase, partial [Muribaculaceae bacterium]|nr:beta-Ala-His dipeptidase [Muribaculaceae bacterium]
MTIKDLNPQAVWSIFDEITKVPRPSGNEEGKLDKIRAWLVDFAKKHNLEYKIDKTGNVAIFRPAAPGYENCKGIVLQGHMDMVAEKGPGSTHNFDTDPIETIIDGEWVRANNTTLGADDGMGLAIALAAVIEPSLKCGPLEALATVDEETGLTGASNIEADMLVGDYLLNLDEEEDGVITMGCAGGLVSIFKFNYKPEAAPKDRVYFEIKFEHLHGGHSGADIHLGYATTTKLSSRLLWNIGAEMDYVLACIDAGNLHNAIAHAATVVVGIKPEDKEKLSVVLNTFIADVKNEYKRTEPKMEITCKSIDVPETIIDTDTARRVVDAVYAAPHGIAAMSMEIPGLVETSTNLASVKMREGNQIVV